MSIENRDGMELYFPVVDSAFHWVRSSSLYSPGARKRHIAVKAMFRREEFTAGVPVFNRFEWSFYFRRLHSLCLSAGVPYLFDLDDLIWELPEYSQQLYVPSQYLLGFPEQLMAGAAAITVSTPELQEHVQRRYPDKPVFLVENSPPAWYAPKSGALIANGDAFKMEERQVAWFVDLLRLIFQSGLSIQLIGENQNLVARCDDILVHSLPLTDYGPYLRDLSLTQYRLALIPVAKSDHADCKSAIKAIEFASQRMPTVASDIAPYRRFASRHAMTDFHIVPNTFEAWKQAVESLIAQIPDAELCKGKQINALLKSTRDTQLQQWLAVIDFLRDRQAPAEKVELIPRKLRPYRLAHSHVRPVVKSIKDRVRKSLRM